MAIKCRQCIDMETTKHHRPGVRLDAKDKALLDKLVRVYGSEAQAIRVAIRTLAERYGAA